jgi:cytochrome P450
MLLFLVAGSETTGTTLSWFIYFMSKYPRVQAKIKAELGDNKNNCLTIEQLDSLVYLDCVLEETFRFIPPAAGTVRSLTVDDRLPGSGVQLHKGDEIFIPFHNLSRDKRCWKIDPELFYPERFQGEDRDHHPYGAIPFGGGHRQCIGQDLARFEVKVITARMMQYVTFGDGGPNINTGGYLQRMTTMPKNVGVTISFDEK